MLSIIRSKLIFHLKIEREFVVGGEIFAHDADQLIYFKVWLIGAVLWNMSEVDEEARPAVAPPLLELNVSSLFLSSEKRSLKALFSFLNDSIMFAKLLLAPSVLTLSIWGCCWWMTASLRLVVGWGSFNKGTAWWGGLVVGGIPFADFLGVWWPSPTLVLGVRYTF